MKHKTLFGNIFAGGYTLGNIFSSVLIISIVTLVSIGIYKKINVNDITPTPYVPVNQELATTFVPRPTTFVPKNELYGTTTPPSVTVNQQLSTSYVTTPPSVTTTPPYVPTTLPYVPTTPPYFTVETIVPYSPINGILKNGFTLSAFFSGILSSYKTTDTLSSNDCKQAVNDIQSYMISNTDNYYIDKFNYITLSNDGSFIVYILKNGISPTFDRPTSNNEITFYIDSNSTFINSLPADNISRNNYVSDSELDNGITIFKSGLNILNNTSGNKPAFMANQIDIYLTLNLPELIGKYNYISVYPEDGGFILYALAKDIKPEYDIITDIITDTFTFNINSDYINNLTIPKAPEFVSTGWLSTGSVDVYYSDPSVLNWRYKYVDPPKLDNFQLLANQVYLYLSIFAPTIIGTYTHINVVNSGLFKVSTYDGKGSIYKNNYYNNNAGIFKVV